MACIVAGIDIHKKVLLVVAADASAGDLHFENLRCGTAVSKRS